MTRRAPRNDAGRGGGSHSASRIAHGWKQKPPVGHDRPPEGVILPYAIRSQVALRVARDERLLPVRGKHPGDRLPAFGLRAHREPADRFAKAVGELRELL